MQSVTMYRNIVPMGLRAGVYGLKEAAKKRAAQHKAYSSTPPIFSGNLHPLSPQAITHVSKITHFRSFLTPLIEAQEKQFEQHPLIRYWLSDCNDKVPDVRKISDLAPPMYEFVLGFSDFNTYYLRYPNHESKTAFHRVINAHTREDETHAALFIKDWRELQLDPLINWKASGFIKTILNSNDEKMKQAVLDLFSIVAEHPHPFMRFGIMETVELAGKVFFSKTAPIVERVKMQTHHNHLNLHYFGHHHLELESGHMENEDVFFSVDDDPKLRDEAKLLKEMYNVSYEEPQFQQRLTELIERSGKIFLDVFDCWLECADLSSRTSTFYQEGFFEPSLPSQWSFNEALKDIERQTSTLISKDDDFVNKLLPFLLVDMVGMAFLAKNFKLGCANFSDAENQLISQMTTLLGNMGDQISIDADKMDIDSIVKKETSEIMEEKFFSPHYHIHRKNLLLFLKDLIENKDGQIRPLLLFHVLKLYEAFIKGISASMYKGTQILGKGDWFREHVMPLEDTFVNLFESMPKEKQVQFNSILHKTVSSFMEEVRQKNEELK